MYGHISSSSIRAVSVITDIRCEKIWFFCLIENVLKSCIFSLPKYQRSHTSFLKWTSSFRRTNLNHQTSVQNRKYSQFIQTVWWLLQSVSFKKVVINLMVLDTRVRCHSSCSNLPHGNTKSPLHNTEYSLQMTCHYVHNTQCMENSVSSLLSTFLDWYLVGLGERINTA